MDVRIGSSNGRALLGGDQGLWALLVDGAVIKIVDVELAERVLKVVLLRTTLRPASEVFPVSAGFLVVGMDVEEHQIREPAEVFTQDLVKVELVGSDPGGIAIGVELIDNILEELAVFSGVGAPLSGDDMDEVSAILEGHGGNHILDLLFRISTLEARNHIGAARDIRSHQLVDILSHIRIYLSGGHVASHKHRARL